MVPPTPGGSSEPPSQVKYIGLINIIGDPAAKEEAKLQAVQELSENFESIMNSSQYPSFLDYAIKTFMKFLLESKPHYVSEVSSQQVRKLLLELIYRFPTNKYLKAHVDSLLAMTFKLLKYENEQNMLVCLRIIIELHKHYRPPFNVKIQEFLKFVKTIYMELPENINKIFMPKGDIRIKELTDLTMDELLLDTFTTTPFKVDKKNADGSPATDSNSVSYSLIPKGVQSLKVLHELPLIVVLMYEHYKENVKQEVTEYIPIIIKTITLHPSPQIRAMANFNKEVFVDFMGVQIKCLSFLAYIIKVNQETVGENSEDMVEGMLSMLSLCPHQVTHLRKELLIAARHILATDLKHLFVPHMGRLFDEDILLGRGWTTHESLRPLAYNTLADLVHHVKQQLPLSDLIKAVHLFSKNVHDETLPTGIQTVSCKLLLNLVECIWQQSEKDPSLAKTTRELLMRMLHVFVLKFKVIAKLHLPILIAKSKQLEAQQKQAALAAALAQQQAQAQALAQQQAATQPQSQAQPAQTQATTPVQPAQTSASTPVPPIQIKKEEPDPEGTAAPKTEEKEVSKSKFGFPQSQSINYSITEYRNLVRTLVCGVKTITFRFKETIKERDTEIFIKLVKWALQALDIYTLSVSPPSIPAAMVQRPPQHQTVRTKDEKEVLEHFSGVFSVMDPQTFREIFSATIDYMVERIFNNLALQIICNSFLSSATTSPIFASVLVEYLLGRMSEMGNGNIAWSNLYLKLFKLVFGSVKMFAAKNEHMLRPHLHQIVNRSMELAMTAKEPFNYFLLLRTLFRSIGGGNHDLLYQEFLPLLPNLLQGLNSLQSGLHKQHMKDLFVELCLTVPVRLSSLLPYLPMLMDPLVSALNGSNILVISQGLRTLELCVDNLQPDFLYEHIQPVRAELMQALWRSLRSQDEELAQAAFRVLGKFGGGNRKMMAEPQKLEYVKRDFPSPSLMISFPEHTKLVQLPLEKVITTAVNTLKPCNVNIYYRKQCWEVVKHYIIASMNFDDDINLVEKLFNNPSFKIDNVLLIQNHYLCDDKVARQTLVSALSGMFFGYIIKDLNDDIQTHFDQVIKQFTLVAISQQAGPVCQEQLTGMDAYVLIDAIAIVMAHDEKELCKPAKTAIHLILNTAISILGSKDKACQLDYFKYMAERMCALCYERAWYTKLGGCLAILYLYESMSIRWLYLHLVEFVKAQLFVIMDLTGEVSSGAIDQASSNLETLIKTCAPLVDKVTDPGLYSVQHEALARVMCELIRLITSPTDLLREQSMHLLKVFADAQGKSIVEVMEPHKAMIPPKKHLLRHQAANAQIGLMEGNTFCTTLTPRLFSLDLKEPDHNTFFHEVLALCEASDASLSKYPCYKNLSSLVPLRKAALRALASCHYLTSMSSKIFDALYQSLDRSNQQLQEAAFDALKTFVQGAQVDMNMVVEVMRPLLTQLGDFRNLNHNGAQRLSYLVQLFPNSFNEKLCDQLLLHLSKITDAMLQSGKSFSKDGESEKAMAIVIGIFGQIPAATAKFVEPLTQMVLQMEKDLLVGVSSPFRKPLLKFQLKFPKQTINLLLSDNNIKDEMWSKYLEFLIKSDDGKPFRDVLQSQAMVDRLITLAMVPTTSATLDLSSFLTPGCKENVMFFSAEEGLEVQYQSMRVVSLLIKFDDQWISTQHHLAQTFRQIWSNDQFLARHKDIQKVEYKHWKEPKLLVKILLNYYSHHPDKIDLLYSLLRAFCERLLPDFQFLRTFLEMTVAQSYTLEWKRAAFFKFVELFHSESSSSDLKAKIIQLVMIPCFAVCFERGEGDKLIGSAPQPNEVYDEKNIISVFIFKVIDPENPFALGDAVRITLLQLSCLLVEQGLAHIHDAETMSQAQGTKLRRIMTYAWPCLLRNNCVDPATRYHGHLLFAHVISKFAIHTLPYKRIVLQVFNSLLKAHAVEVRGVVRQALEILTPAMPARMVGGYTMLTHWTKKIIVEEGHLMQQLFHILQLIVRHYLVYYPVRHHLISHMVNALQRLAFSNSSSIEHRKLAVELAEIIIRWEVQRIKEEAQQPPESKTEVEAGQKRSASESDGEQPPPKKPHVYKSDPSENRPLDRIHVDAVLNFLARLACQVNEPPQPGSANVINTSPGEVLSRRCYHLIRMALKPDVWNQQLVDIRVAWMDKLLATVGQSNANLGNICIALELLTFLITVMKEEQILYTCKPLQKGLNACISSNNNKVIRVTHVFLTRLMSIFPTEPCASTVSSKHEELECIYSAVGRVVYEGLDNYEKSPNANSASLFGTVMMLKAACAFNPSYVDRLINHFVRVIHRMSREHMAAKPAEQPPGSVELLILSLDLVKNRVGVMTGETKKTFIGSILVGLIEKTQEIKVMKAICSMVEEWMKNTKVQPSGMVTANTNCGPTLREKSILLVKLMQYVEKRFPDLNTQFLELVNYIYKDETFKNSELIPKLEPAFLAGLRCTHPQIREKFFEIFDNSIRRRIHDRLMYIVSSQNWEPMGHHYWLKQCIELILVSSDQNSLIQLSSETPLLPSVTSVVYQANTEDRESFLNSVTINVEPMEIDEKYDPSRDIGGIPLLSELIADHKKFTESCKKVKAANFLRNISQLCHHDTALTEKIWLDIFPRLWQVLSDRQRAALSGELLPFLVSGVHVTQKDIHPSSVSTIFEALSNCNPPIQLKPGVMSYLGKSHNLWHRVTLGLEKILAEQMNSSPQAKQRRDVLDCYDFEPDIVPHQAGMEHLAEMYSQLREEDMWVGLWTKHCRYKETAVALAYEQQGYFEKALGAYELVLGKGRQDFINTPAPLFLLAEERLWEKGWIRCSKELNQWKHLLDYAKTKGNLNPYLILESAWRIPDWDLMKEAINHVETSCPKDLLWKVHLYRGYLAICHPDEQHLPIVERYVELASSLIMKEWRRLPHVVSHIHLPLLQAAQQIMELQEACLIHQALSHDSSYLTHEQKSSLHDMKAIVKTWRNRLPIVGDDLCHWSDIFTWRQHHYQYINDHYVAQSDQGTEASTHSMFGVHSSVQALIHFAKIARKHNLTRVCLDLLARIYTIPQVPIKDCFQKIRQQLKCYLQMALQSGNKELQEGLEVAESTNLNYFTKEVTSEFYALKGKLFSQMGGRSEDANKAFSAAVQQHDTLVKAWAFWGDFIEEQFTKSPNPDIQTGVCAITCFLHACRHQNESKSRKYLAKVLWLLTYDDANNTLAAAVDKYVVGVPPVQWLPWIPQLLTCLIRSEGNSMLNLLSQVARMYPQAVYFPLRTLYLTLKIEQMERERERYKNAELAATLAAKQGVQPKPADQGNAPDGSGPIKATPAMWRCSKIMQKDIHPTVLSSLEGLVDQMVWFRETWYEEVLRQLRQGLTKCYVLAFENRGAVTEATITPHTLHFVKKLKSTFGLGIENPSGMNSSNSNQSGTQQSNSSLSESLAKRYEVTLQDPIFQPMKEQFSAEFDFTVPGAMKLQNLIQKLKKWIKILEAKTKLQPKSFLIEEKGRFLSNFTLQTAEMELPGEFLLPKHSHYFVRISRFMPRVEIVQKHNTAARRLYIRGHNGKIYPYLVVNDSGLGDARREERVLQLLRMINHYFPKQKETAKRLLQVTVPRVVAVLPQMRLVEDNPCSLSLLDIYRSACSTRDTDHDAPVTKYYDKLASIQARGMQATLPNLKEILKDVQTSLVPKTLLKEWAVNTYPSPTDYWTFRKMVTLQLSLACFCEYVLHLTRLNPDMMYLHQDSGLLNVSYFKFNVDDMKGELDANRPVPFRLTPNIQELLTDTGINGPLTASMIAAARCLSYPNFKVTTILKAILRDEMIFAHKKQKQEEQQAEVPPGTAVAAVGGEQIIKMVTNAVDSISDRLNSLANFDDAESKVTTLVVAARNADNLCRMDPAWHPWL